MRRGEGRGKRGKKEGEGGGRESRGGKLTFGPDGDDLPRDGDLALCLHDVGEVGGVVLFFRHQEDEAGEFSVLVLIFLISQLEVEGLGGGGRHQGGSCLG